MESPEDSTLGLHRALYYNDREGYTEIFRPHARPGNQWIEEVADFLARHLILALLATTRTFFDVAGRAKQEEYCS
ncbi:MAG TPA: hypothetical protein VFY06_12915 [Verrucomicrobiae bacterium]|nr:hypothetical protein [Verrucomicrobiae bacterium]